MLYGVKVKAPLVILPSLPLRRVAVPDTRYDWLCEHWKPPSCVPAYLHVVDIAGLVQGAHEGKVCMLMHPDLDLSFAPGVARD